MLLLARGFAFSQAPGQDKLVTEGLVDRVGVALIRQIQATSRVLTFEQPSEAEEQDSFNEINHSKTSSSVFSNVGSSTITESQLNKELPNRVTSQGDVQTYRNAVISIKTDHVGKIDELSESVEASRDGPLLRGPK